MTGPSFAKHIYIQLWTNSAVRDGLSQIAENLIDHVVWYWSFFPYGGYLMGDELLQKDPWWSDFFVCWKQSNQPQCRCHPPHNCHYPFFKLRYVWCESSIKWDKPKAPPFQDDKNLYDCLEVSPDFETKPGFFMSSSGLSHYLQLGNNPATGMLQVMLGWSSFLWLNP